MEKSLHVAFLNRYKIKADLQVVFVKQFAGETLIKN